MGSARNLRTDSPGFLPHIIIGGVERDYLLVSYKGGDKLYVPSDQIDTLRQYVGGESPTYRLKGDETYVRATVIDSGGRTAWVQPVWVER